MRARLALTAAAVTAMIVVAFCIPLVRLIRVVAVNRALDAAKLESRSLAGAISAVGAQKATITQLVDQANAGSPRPITVHLSAAVAWQYEQPRLGTPRGGSFF